VKVKALGQEVLESLTAGQHFSKFVHDELVQTLGMKRLSQRGAKTM